MTIEPMAVVAGMRLSDGRTWAEAAAPWQVADMEALLSEEGPRSHFLTRPRGGSKSSDVAAALIALSVTGAMRGDGHVWATDGDQARLVQRAAQELVSATPELSGLLEFTSKAMTSTTWGGTVAFMAADAGGSYGLRSEFLVADELAAWPATPTHLTTWEAILSTRAKVAGCRLVAITSAGAPDSMAFEVLENARASSQWRVSEVPGPLPWVDHADLEDQARMLPESAYRRLHLNEWCAGDDGLATLEDIEACVRREHPTVMRDWSVGRYVISVDLGLREDRTVVAVMHRADGWVPTGGVGGEAARIDAHLAALRGRAGEVPSFERTEAVEGTYVLDEMIVFDPAGSVGNKVSLVAVEDEIMRLAAKYRGARVVIDPWQAALVVEHLREVGVRVREFTFSVTSVGRLALGLFTAIRDRRLDLYQDDALMKELAGVRLVEKEPGSYRLDHARGQHDDRAIALAMGIQELSQAPPSPPVMVMDDQRLVGRR